MTCEYLTEDGCLNAKYLTVLRRPVFKRLLSTLDLCLHYNVERETFVGPDQEQELALEQHTDWLLWRPASHEADYLKTRNKNKQTTQVKN